jgi:hypothetical protein
MGTWRAQENGDGGLYRQGRRKASLPTTIEVPWRAAPAPGLQRWTAP